MKPWPDLKDYRGMMDSNIAPLANVAHNLRIETNWWPSAFSPWLDERREPATFTIRMTVPKMITQEGSVLGQLGRNLW
jgi:hypothetical protein